MDMFFQQRNKGQVKIVTLLLIPCNPGQYCSEKYCHVKDTHPHKSIQLNSIVSLLLDLILRALN